MERFVLAGNGGHLNRGCEAIERGTLQILRHAFPQASYVVAPFGEESGDVECGSRCTRVPRVLWGSQRGTPSWAIKNAMLRLAPRAASRRLFDFAGLAQHIQGASALLQLGGDNFSLDYGGPEPFFSLNDFARHRRCPVVLWGASVGPFDKEPRYERRAIRKLGEVDLILVRETRTLEYLQDRGLGDRTELVADPAFVMEPCDPAGSGYDIELPPGAVGVNLSPLYARYVGRTSDWAATCAEVVAAIALATSRPIVLVPHVVVPAENDYSLLSEIQLTLASRGVETLLIPEGLGAPELKWCIGRLSAFVGSRTHATIAALSQAVPTVSLAYSVKAYGINVDLLGSDEYVVPAAEFGAESVVSVLKRALDDESGLKRLLEARAGDWRDRAMSAGRILRERVLAR